MHASCPQCGHHFDTTSRVEQAAHIHGIVPDIGVDISSSTSPPAEDLAAADPVERPSRRPLFLAAAVAAALVGLGLFVLTRGDESAVAEPDRLEPTELDQAIGSIEPGDNRVDSSANAGPQGDANFPPSNEHLEADRISDLFRLEVDGALSYAVVYPSQMGLQILSSEGVTNPTIEVAVGFEEAVRLPLLSDGSRTWAIDPTDRQTAYLVSTQFVVVDVETEGSVAFVNNSLEPINVGISSFGAWGPGFDVPAGSDILAIPGRGLLILPETGGTFKLTSSGAKPISPDRAVAASLHSEVYRRCDDALDCELYVASRDGDEVATLDLDASARVYLSPEGDYLLTASGEGLQIIRVATGDSWTLGDRSVEAAGWSPDGDFVAVASGDDLLLAYPETERIEEMTLPIQTASSSLLVVSSSG